MEEHIDNLLKYIPNLISLSILDIGSEKGDFVLEIAKRGGNAIGLEKNENYIKVSFLKAEKEGLSINIVKGEAEKLPFDDSKFSFINMSELIEHVENPKKVLEENFRVLRPKGVAYVSVHNRFGVYDSHFHLWFINWMPRWLAEKYIGMRRKHKPYEKTADRQRLTDMHYFTFESFKKMANDVGFSVCDVREGKIIKKLERIKPFHKLAIGVYRLFRPFYFNVFHLLLVRRDLSL